MNKKQRIKAIKKIYNTIQNGWCRHTEKKIINNERHYCLTGAIRENIEDYDAQLEMCDFLYDYLPEENKGNLLLSGFVRGLQQFNDSKKDKRQVLRFLNRVLDKLSAK